MKRICYILLSPSLGMHEYTAGLAHVITGAGHDVHLVTTARAPRECYRRAITIHTPVATTRAGASPEALRLRSIRDLRSAVDLIGRDLRPDVVHLTGPHPWNVALMRALRRRGIPAVHSLHSLNPQRGLAYTVAIRLWNRRVVRSADHILVHGPAYRQRLLDAGLPTEQVTWTPLLHLFLGGTRLEANAHPPQPVTYEPWALYLGSLERRGGLEHLITACAMMDGAKTSSPRLVVAGPGDLSALWAGPLPERLAVRDRSMSDREAEDLLCRCGLLVLPNADWSQPAWVAAAYYYHKPVIVTRSGALPEYVLEGRTGYVVEAGHPTPLARRLEELLDDSARLAKMGAAARAWYDAQRVQEEKILLEMYTRLAA